MPEGRGQRVLVTGATGFIGRHLAADLARRGWEVHALVRREGSGAGADGPWVAHVVGGGTAEIVRRVGEARPDLVIHLASRFLAAHRPEDVAPLVDANVLFGTQLLEAMSACGCTRLVNAGTSWQHHENEDYNPVCLYAATKQAFADILRYYTAANGVRAVTLELFDTYGPGDPRPKIFSLLRQAARAGTVLDLSPGEQLLDLVYIDDVTAAFRLAALRLLAGESAGAQEVFAVSCGRPRSLREIVATWQRVAAAPLVVRWGERPYRSREVMVPWNRGTPLPGWAARVGLEEGIRRMEAPVAGAACPPPTGL